jgi:hypothetical protein
MIPPKIHELCRSDKSVTNELTKNPSEAPGKAAKRLFGHDLLEDVAGERMKESTNEEKALQHAFECGNWGPTRPSDLFLQVSQ